MRARTAARSTGGRAAPGRVVSGAAPLRILRCNASGKPPGAWPSSPRNSCTTDSGNATSVAGSSTWARLSPEVTMRSAMSPTALEVGVTLMMSPNIALTSA